MVAALLTGLMAVPPVDAQMAATTGSQTSSLATQSTTKKGQSAEKSSRKKATHRRRRVPSARTRRIRQAFIASVELQPMAQQLATMRTPEAYEGVRGYAERHTGEAAAAAYLALGHAYLLDRRYTEAAANLQKAHRASGVLADYADFLGAQAEQGMGDPAAAEALLKGFATRYPDSIFVVQAPETEAEVLLSMQDAAGAKRVLNEAAHGPAVARPGYQLAMAETAEAMGDTAQAIGIYKSLLVGHPLTDQAVKARAKLTDLGAEGTLTVTELRSLADAYYRAHRYNLAGEQYRALVRKTDLPQEARDGFLIAAAACDLKLKRLTVADAEALPDSQDDNGARRMYLLMELARDRDDEDQQQSIVSTMETRFGASEWLAEALFSSGNMYMLQRDYPKAVSYYSYLAEHFPESRYAAAAHWRSGWLSYRQGLYGDAARLFDDQISRYPNASETVAALYWRARLYEMQDHNPARAAANYRAIVRAFPHYFYAQMARMRLQAMGRVTPAAAPGLERFKPADVPTLDGNFPDDNEHLAKARLLGNAGLNEYIPREIAADPDSASWSALAEAKIYASFGENFLALRALKRALPYAASAEISAIPLAYWRILFPQPYWETIKAESAKNHLDPYLVASLIRQESEFNPSVVSYANAWGLMQLLPKVGRQLARQEGLKHFSTYQLLNPEMNIRLGTRYLRQMLDRFNGVPEYALAAYNAGDNRVADWQAAGPYSGMDEFVESIPFTQTREYVEAILRNIEIYKAIDAARGSEARSKGGM
jgi:soluble lytic murein transglycosylase